MSILKVQIIANYFPVKKLIYWNLIYVQLPLALRIEFMDVHAIEAEAE